MPKSIRITLLTALLLLLGLAINSLWLERQYRDYRELASRAAPLVNDLHQVHQDIIMLDAGNGISLEGKIQDLLLSLGHFNDYLEGRRIKEPALQPVMAELHNYLSALSRLQEEELRLHYALNVFHRHAEQLETVGPEQAARIGRLSELSELYLHASHPAYVDHLANVAQSLAGGAEERLSDLLYGHQLYRQSLRRIIDLRRRLGDDDATGLLQLKNSWEAQLKRTKERLLLNLALILGVIFSAGMAWLHVRNKQLTQTNQASMALARAKTDFLANMSHEIRTPMNAIIGFSSLLQQTPLTAQQAEYIKKIRTSSDNLLLLINDILDLTKVESGKLELEDIAFDLNQQLDTLSGLFADMSEQKQLEVIINKSPEVPEYLQGDPLRLGQVLVNLVSNAVKFTERGEVVLAVYLNPENSQQLCFEVKDTGIGIMPEKLVSLFKPFTQLDASTTRKYGGSGLGLNISRHLVQLMRGTISVQSQPGLGSTFKVVLPLREAAAGAHQDHKPVFIPGQKILLVDDNELVLEIMGRIIREAGFVLYTARDSMSAREIIQQRGSELRLVLIDCRLGHDNGMELASFITRQHHLARLDIVITSAFGRERPAGQMDSLGIRHFLSKPVTEKSLLACLSKVLNPRPEAMALLSANTDDTWYYRKRLMGCHLLLAEDNRVNQQLIVEFLAKVGVTVTLANHGQQAIDMVSKKTFDAILMDLQMPILDGLQATRQIRKLGVNHRVPIIALTASAMRGDRETSLEAGMNGYVTKPVNRIELYQALLQVGLGPGQSEAQAAPEADNGGLRDSDAHGGEGDYLALEQVRSRLERDRHAFALLLRLFLDEHQDDVWELQAALANGDGPEAGRVLHRLAVVAANIHAEPLATLADTLMAEGRQGASLSRGAIEELTRVFAKTREQAAQALNHLSWSAESVEE
ncbi:hybrid sensor histidine kinase/response regulator [Zobellella maritima]|uniref:hybrid sensor histidine kinase/response regulator n=1 Tax=Zobellella maritima TaxID=2059725 RepID=UPI0018E56666|nr:response regulator [Zobellella maritima]